MTDDNGDDTQPWRKGIEDRGILGKAEQQPVECGQVDLIYQLQKDVWNRAIEKAASISEFNSAANIRKLKL